MVTSKDKRSRRDKVTDLAASTTHEGERDNAVAVLARQLPASVVPRVLRLTEAVGHPMRLSQGAAKARPAGAWHAQGCRSHRFRSRPLARRHQRKVSC